MRANKSNLLWKFCCKKYETLYEIFFSKQNCIWDRYWKVYNVSYKNTSIFKNKETVKWWILFSIRWPKKLKRDEKSRCITDYILLRKLKERKVLNLEFASYPWGHVKVQTQLCLQILGIKKYRNIAIWSSVSVCYYCQIPMRFINFKTKTKSKNKNSQCLLSIFLIRW